jgi:hypothetical protein
MAALKLGELKSWIADRVSGESNYQQKAHLNFALSVIDKFDKSYETPMPNDPSDIPEGSPIGTTLMNKDPFGYNACY